MCCFFQSGINGNRHKLKFKTSREHTAKPSPTEHKNMETFFEPEFQDNATFWYESLPVNQSAFVQYSSRPRSEFGPGIQSSGSSVGNMNKRMIEFLRRSWPGTGRSGNGGGEPEKERTYRHMMNERVRREKQRLSYLALQSMLPMGNKVDYLWQIFRWVFSVFVYKFIISDPSHMVWLLWILLQNDKKSVVQIAAMQIQQMQWCKEELIRKKMELEKILDSKEKEMVTGTIKINLKEENPASGVDSMAEVLKFLKQNRLQTTSIQSVFSPELFQAQLQIQTKVDTFFSPPQVFILFTVHRSVCSKSKSKNRKLKESCSCSSTIMFGEKS